MGGCWAHPRGQVNDVHERVLVVEDDRSVRETATLLLERAGLRVTAVGDGHHALEEIAGHRVELVLLDVMLPYVDGFEVCRSIRRDSQIPIVMLTARADTADVVAGLELGADDYLTKPFQAAELVARVRAALRRRTADSSAPRLQIQDLDIDAAAFRVNQAGRPVELTATEFRLLVELARSAEHVVSREALLERVWGYDYLGDSRLVDMAVKRLRDKLGDDARCPRYIATVRGAGYRLAG
jgi:two-component system response regulator MtrA